LHERRALWDDKCSRGPAVVNAKKGKMKMKRRLLVMDAKDKVGVLLEDVKAGDTCNTGDREIEILEDIEFGHKVALVDLAVNEAVVKYGHEIGHAEKPIRRGQWVHVHNMGCRRGK